MKVMTILGTRPEIIRLSLIIPALDKLCDHVLVHTGQNFTDSLSRIFFDQLELREPDHHLGIRAASAAQQIAAIIEQTAALMQTLKPDRLLILGDTNSGLAAIMAKRMGIPVYHMEAGNRCFDDRVPEEVNRRIIDHASDVLMPYTERSRDNLLHEGIASQNIYVTGNPINEVMQAFANQTEASTVLETLDLQPAEYFLVTLHRAETVDVPDKLAAVCQGLQQVRQDYGLPVIVSTHPRTHSRMEEFKTICNDKDVRFLEPFGFFDFLKLEKNCRCLLTDSGTAQEEACILGIPAVTVRETTERPETIECGSNVLSGTDPQRLQECVRMVLSRSRGWTAPAEYVRTNVTDTVLNVLLGRR